MNTLITGASSGIGEALALACAKRGDTLFLCGRNEERLEAVAKKCRAFDVPTYATVVDVTSEEEVRGWMQACDDLAPIERVFSNVVLTAIELFRKRGAGQILLTASIAGYGPLKSCPAYSATKSCVKTWGLSLRGMLAPEGIKVSVICPGFVRSRITDQNTCPMPFFMEADKAANIILKRADKNVGLIAFPWQMRFATWWLSTLPFRLNEFINSLLPKKVSTR